MYVRSVGASRKNTMSQAPWRIALILVALPVWMFAEERTITWVMGSPPIKPLTVFPTPWANNSRLVGVTRFWGSNLSVASTHNSVSKLATTAMVTPKIQMALSPMAEKSGKVSREPQAVGSMPLAAWPVGTSTNCLAVRAPAPLFVKRLTTTPAKRPRATLTALW